MADENARVLKQEQVSRKEFTYSLDGVNLNFTLRIDVKKELKAFEQILKAAAQDVDAELKKL